MQTELTRLVVGNIAAQFAERPYYPEGKSFPKIGCNFLPNASTSDLGERLPVRKLYLNANRDLLEVGHGQRPSTIAQITPTTRMIITVVSKSIILLSLC